MEQENAESRPSKGRRTAKACIQCRQSKIKCSGSDPCQNCQRRAIRCTFDRSGNKVMVSEKYLQDLQRQAARSPSTSNGDSQIRADSHHHSPSRVNSAATALTSPSVARTVVTSAEPTVSRKRSADAAFGLNDDSYATYRTETSLVSPASLTEPPSQPHDINRSPLSAPPPTTRTPFNVWSSASTVPSKTIKNMRNNRRAWLWLAPWSTWSFTFRLILLLREHLHPEDPDVPCNLLDTEIYRLTWESSSPTAIPDVSGLPSLNHAIYLVNTVRFHLGQTYRFFSDDFENEIRDFYANARQRAVESRLWFVKFLLILAFGTAFLAPPKDSPDPPGSKWFTRAMTLIPDTSSLWRDSLLAIEVLALAGMYLHSIDERESAGLCLVQAIRIAQMEGMHTPLPEDELGVETVSSCRNLWWTLYIMDRHFSSSLGIPMSLQDSDITTPVNPPTYGSQEDSARSVQVNLSHLLAVILTSVYKPNQTPLDQFLDQTRSVLHTLAHHALEIERIFRVKFQNSVGTMPRDGRFLALLYHKCVIFATRPLLLSVMKERLDILGNPADENWESFLAQTRTVISTGIKSAAKTLEILTSGDSLLQSFLVYDLEFTFEAALHLTMANALFPGVVDYERCHRLAHQILDELVSRGNRVAHARRSELYHLEGLCRELVAKVRQQGHQTLHLFDVNGTGSPDFVAATGNHGGHQHDRLLPQEGEQSNGGAMTVDPWHHLPYLAPPPLETPSNTEFRDCFGISSEEFLHIVQQMGDPETLPESMLTLG
ncbi:hypothetical protein VTK73DRAFT_187 [Phialemonium thermophilum]|uniref:Zn(2)-C6 fungal-type domain-containing protein n=1 Tax=Phialemonium thermophilum TaxID=223376 RepID=A0ABR3XGM0_9PEZI